MVTIKVKGFEPVNCYGSISEYAAIEGVFDDEEYDCITESCFKNWRAAVTELTAYAKRNGTTLIECTSDER
jgi:hypothetical protein